MASCGEDFINIEPVSTASVDAVYKTDKDFQDAVIGIYSTLQTEYQNFWIFGDVRGDDSEQQVVKNDAWYLSDAFILNSDNTRLRDAWRNYYLMITRANVILQKIEEVDPAVVKNKDRHKGEALFLRAMAYFDLVRLFGGVPLLKEPIDVATGYATPRATVDAVYNDMIIPDFKAAEALLPVSYTGADVGRATKGAARAMLGRVYVTRSDWGNAEAKLNEVTTMGYALLANYKDLFDYSKNEHHSEYIFDVEYQENMTEGSVFTNRFMPNSASMATFYGVKGGLTETNSPTPALIALFNDPNDTRKDLTIGVKGGFYNSSGTFVTLPSATSQTYTKKYLYPVPLAEDSKANWKVIRYADVLLMYAEALNENGKTTEALTYLNMIRTRAKVPTYSGLNQSDTREAIYLERRLELSFEGVRWFDLVRTGRALQTMEPRGMKAHMTVFPLPLSQVQIINDPSIFPQNPGYD